ncbi:S8 family peptidase [Actinomadura flavalba]|uniref:S8 family peptidase n=1 Tax=Actinomadura flavalba TaxID=1120938 RepID=UPI0004762661|nr:S8 family serine peptidase [Actinomadura flavalba]
MRWTALAVVAGCVLPFASAPVAQAAPPQQCRPERGNVSRQMLDENPDLRWWQQVINLSAAHETATGKGVRVAVVDSGVNYVNPQLRGQVLKGADVSATNAYDCIGHGTAVAGLIAAKRGVSPFYGVAPEAKIIPVKFAASAQANDSGLAAKGIDAAVRLGADVINISTQSISDDPRLRTAVQKALEKNIPVVAAAGNLDVENGQVPEPMYPGAYPGVITVGAVDASGKITTFSNPKTPVTVIAPGIGVVTTSADGVWISKDGTSFATPIVAGVVALMKQAHPELTPAQIKTRLERTADGGKGAGSGAGMVNPSEAVNAVLTDDGSGPQSGALTPVTIIGPDRADPRTRTIALGIAGGGVAAAALVAAAGLLYPHGRRRRWKPGRAVVEVDQDAPVERRFR